MNPQDHAERLSLIPTQWSLVYLAHHGPTEANRSARQQLLDRYGEAARRYLRKLLQDPDADQEIFQEFALRLLKGDLRGANPELGRFRNFVKGTLFHLIANYRKQKQRWPGPLPEEGSTWETCQQVANPSCSFEESWCDHLLARAWTALAESEAGTSQPYYAVLRFRADHPESRAPQLAQELTAQLGRTFTAAGVRQILHRARGKFAAFLLDEVAHSLESPTAEQLEAELAELGLLDYCRPALEQRLRNG
jgi:DNA-directed RNA polymerase specialized sigma24 family protein